VIGSSVTGLILDLRITASLFWFVLSAFSRNVMRLKLKYHGVVVLQSCKNFSPMLSRKVSIMTASVLVPKSNGTVLLYLQSGTMSNKQGNFCDSFGICLCIPSKGVVLH
jgi:hypothetical protein